MQPLATCMHNLQLGKMAIGLQISEPWLREYQVHVIYVIHISIFWNYTPCTKSFSYTSYLCYSSNFYGTKYRLHPLFYNLFIYVYIYRYFHLELTHACKWVHLGATFSVELRYAAQLTPQLQQNSFASITHFLHFHPHFCYVSPICGLCIYNITWIPMLSGTNCHLFGCIRCCANLTFLSFRQGFWSAKG